MITLSRHCSEHTSFPARTVGKSFTGQLADLSKRINQSDPHFIRCVKPTPNNIPDDYHKDYVATQLRAGGVLQAIEVHRWLFHQGGLSNRTLPRDVRGCIDAGFSFLLFEVLQYYLCTILDFVSFQNV